MNTEEKAKAYDEALERAQKVVTRAGSDVAMDIVRYIFPEFAENDDEKIRKEIISALKFANDGGVYDKHIAYLEKQKEQKKPNIELIQKSWYRGGYNDREFGKEPKWIIKTGEGGPKYEENPKYGQMLEAEQKPVEIHIDNPNIEKFDKNVKITTSDSSADDDKLLYVFKSYDIGYRDGKRDAEKKSAEYIPFSEGYKTGREVGFREGVKSTKPAEWSEEDEKTINNACCWIAEYAGYLMDKNYDKASMLISLTDKLKSLRPQLKKEWSEEDDKMLFKVCCLINPGTKLTAENADYCIELKQWIVSLQERILKSLRPQPHWKPSEEQMKYIDVAIAEANGHKSYNLAAGLEKLKNDLLKL